MLKNKGFVIFLLIFGILIIMSTYNVVRMNGTLYGDEYVFQRITSQLPNYSVSADWFLKDRIDLRNPGLIDEVYITEYTTKVWIHPPLINYIMWPISKIIDLDKPNIARFIPLVLMLTTALLIADVIRRRYNWIMAGLSLLPFIFSQRLLGEGLWLYYDCFMYFFLTVSIWLVVVKPNSRWIWISLIAMVLSKEVAIIFLPVIFLLSKNWKYLLTGLALVPYLAWLSIANGNIMYLLNHWIAVGKYNVRESFFAYAWTWGLWSYFAFTVLGIWQSIKNKENLPYLLLYGLILLYGIPWAGSPYAVLGILYSGMFMVAIGFNWIQQYIEKQDKATRLKSGGLLGT